MRQGHARLVATLAVVLIGCVSRKVAGATDAAATGKPARADAKPKDDPYAPLSYRFIGPPGNRTSAVVGVAGDPNTYHVGAASGGVWKSTDVGGKAIFDDQLEELRAMPKARLADAADLGAVASLEAVRAAREDAGRRSQGLRRALRHAHSRLQRRRQGEGLAATPDRHEAGRPRAAAEPENDDEDAG